MSKLRAVVGWQLGAAFDAEKGAWGDSLSDALKGVTAKQAAWRPAEGRRSIGEIVNHLTYWKNVALGQLDAGAVPAEAPKADWQPTPDEAAWTRALDQLQRSHAALAGQLSGMDEAALDDKPEAKGWPAWKVTFLSMAAHDAYHTGQIVTLRELQG